MEKYTEQTALHKIKNKCHIKSSDPLLIARMIVISPSNPPGNKIWGAIEYLQNYHGYRWVKAKY